MSKPGIETVVNENSIVMLIPAMPDQPGVLRVQRNQIGIRASGGDLLAQDVVTDDTEDRILRDGQIAVIEVGQDGTPLRSTWITPESVPA